jgi:hypothetical protein
MPITRKTKPSNIAVAENQIKGATGNKEKKHWLLGYFNGNVKYVVFLSRGEFIRSLLNMTTGCLFFIKTWNLSRIENILAGTQNISSLS